MTQNILAKTKALDAKDWELSIRLDHRTFENMTRAQLREFINGCHAGRAYDALFDQACRILNSRFF